MADGLADHRNPPRAMQLGSMLRGEGVKGNGKGQWGEVPLRLGSLWLGGEKKACLRSQGVLPMR